MVKVEISFEAILQLMSKGRIIPSNTVIDGISENDILIDSIVDSHRNTLILIFHDGKDEITYKTIIWESIKHDF